jgi:hypothetical protein
MGIAAAVLLFAACKKSTLNPAQAIIGKWYYSKERVQNFTSGGTLYRDTTYSLFSYGQYIQYNTNGTGVYYTAIDAGPYIDFTYNLSGNTETETYQGISPVYTVTVNGSILTRHGLYTYPNGYYIIEDDTFHR